MNSHLTSFGSCIWTEGLISEGKEVYLYDGKEGGVFLLQKCSTYYEAEIIYDSLAGQPYASVPKLLPPFTVTTNPDDWLLAQQKCGKSLSEFLELADNHSRFYMDGIILSFYQQLLLDLIRVVRSLMETKIKCVLSLSDICISEDRLPLASVTKFEWRKGCNDFSVDWHKLASVILEINRRIDYQGSEEMMHLIRALFHPIRIELDSIPTLSMFWSLNDRIRFCYQFSDLIQSGTARIGHRCKAFGPGTISWREIVDGHRALRLMRAHDNSFKVEPRKNDLSRQRPEDETKYCLRFIRNCFCHFMEMKTSAQDLGLQTTHELLVLFELTFKDFIYRLYIRASELEEQIQKLRLVPEKTGLCNLFKESNI